jgi:hypothetical protein
LRLEPRDDESAGRVTMNQIRIFVPMFVVIMLTLLVWVYMYARRIPFILKTRVPLQQLSAFELARISPPAVSNPSDNLKNLFEVPTVFYALTLYLYVTHQVDGTYLTAAWLFAALRVAHSLVHCTFNYIPLRFWMYVLSTGAVWFMAVRAALNLPSW